MHCGPDCRHGLNRRQLGGLFAGLAAGTMLPAARAVESSAGVQRIDVHHHILPPVFRQTLGEAHIGAPAPNGVAPPWQVADSLGVMDRQGITTAVVSAAPIWTPDTAQNQRLTRACNEFAAQMMADHPSRFGSFASLPLPDVKASLAELAHALDVLKADGIQLMTNYADKYLGDPAFAPVMDELNRRKAVVYVHPQSCGCSKGLIAGMPDSMVEFPHDTSRTVTSLLFSGTFGRCPDIRFIFSHAGGTVPYLATRMATLGALDRELAKKVPEGVMPLLKKLYYDTAISANPISLAALFKFVSPRQVVLGTDFPFVPERGTQATLAGLRQATDLTEADLRAIEGENVAALLPRVARVGARVAPAQRVPGAAQS